jgi:hypothetical protein
MKTSFSSRKCISQKVVHLLQSDVQMKIRSSAVGYRNVTSNDNYQNLKQLTIFLIFFFNTAYPRESAS